MFTRIPFLVRRLVVVVVVVLVLLQFKVYLTEYWLYCILIWIIFWYCSVQYKIAVLDCGGLTFDFINIINHWTGMLKVSGSNLGLAVFSAGYSVDGKRGYFFTASSRMHWHQRKIVVSHRGGGHYMALRFLVKDLFLRCRVLEFMEEVSWKSTNKIFVAGKLPAAMHKLYQEHL